MPIRCPWCEVDDLMRHYHDTEWGVPVHDDDLLFEYMLLDAFQAGLSWRTILNKRENFRKAFSGFQPGKVARFNQQKVERLMNDAGIVRNRQKIEASISNARKFLELQSRHGSFDAFIWQFTDGRVRQNAFRTEKQIPAKTKQSDAMSKELKAAGFKFVGTTICYAFMQAAGMVNDHIVSCHRYRQLRD